MTTIQFKRSTTTEIPSTSAFAEPSISDVGGVLRVFAGTSGGATKEIAGDNFAKLDSPSFKGTPTAPTAASGNSSDLVATTAFVAAAIAGISGGMEYKGTIDASSNPNYPAATKGDVYKISVAGKIGGPSGIAVQSGDMVICNETNAGGTQAAVGADFDIIQGNIEGVITFSQAGGAATNVGDIPVFDNTSGTTIKTANVSISTDASFDNASDNKLPTQLAVKTLVDNVAAMFIAGDGINMNNGEISVRAESSPTGTLAAVNVSATGVGVKIDGTTITQTGGILSAVAPSNIDGGTF